MVADQGVRQERMFLSHLSSLRAELQLPPVATLSLPASSLVPLAQSSHPQVITAPPTSPQVHFDYQFLMGTTSLSPLCLPIDTPHIQLPPQTGIGQPAFQLSPPHQAGPTAVSTFSIVVSALRFTPDPPVETAPPASAPNMTGSTTVSAPVSTSPLPATATEASDAQRAIDEATAEGSGTDSNPDVSQFITAPSQPATSPPPTTTASTAPPSPPPADA
ncbi:polycystic kidney disease protein 1-like 3 [Panicum virgatum]|jgi:hypothetical protein|uniref:polycystic kidney disease protein 1-like 3 n=1 Tax=Panicum virgatum TaxID=38727 RepID=UPI0019D56ECC|nr:polycystic kidney disease protein 1-like 3 [Panicum virgatum]